jgi:hypothetical protein
VIEISTEAASSDEELERRIDHQALLLKTVPTPEERRTAWETLKQLIAQRSPAQIERMEAGLR